MTISSSMNAPTQERCNSSIEEKAKNGVSLATHKAIQPLESLPKAGGEPNMTDEYEESMVEYQVDTDVVQEEIGEEPRSIILAMIAQLTKGMDLHRITFPTFVLEPRSLLERITDFMAHPSLILEAGRKQDGVERFLDVLRYYLSGWHIRPRGVKKPYNPVLGEFFRCLWRCPDQSDSFYIAEQVSHHPPVSAYFYANPTNGIVAMGNFKPKGRFLGNSVMSLMQGTSHLFLLDHPGEEYILSNPNIYARGVLFGTMLMELGDGVTIRCEKTDLIAEIEFKIKGYFTGAYNMIGGKIKRISTGETLYELSGKWTESIYICRPRQTQQLFLDLLACPIVPKLVAPLQRQDHYESRRLWQHVTEALKLKDYDRATEEKLRIEDEQRLLTKLRSDDDIEWRPKFFRYDGDDFWHFIDLDVYTLPVPYFLYPSCHMVAITRCKESRSKLTDHLRDSFARHYGLGAPICFDSAIN